MRVRSEILSEDKCLNLLFLDMIRMEGKFHLGKVGLELSSQMLDQEGSFGKGFLGCLVLSFSLYILLLPFFMESKGTYV